MNIEQLEKDYHQVRDLSLKVFETDINPIRCHEMAYLIATGMRKKGYDALVINGTYDGRMEHSWIRIQNNGFWLSNTDVLIDFQFNQLSRFFTPPIWRDALVIDRKKRRDFKKKGIKYQLTEGIEAFAEQLFP